MVGGGDKVVEEIPLWGKIGETLASIKDKIQFVSDMEATGWALVALGIGGIIAGTIIALDDIRDLGLLSYPGHASPIHHWVWGVILIILSILPLALGLAIVIKERFKHKK